MEIFWFIVVMLLIAGSGHGDSARASEIHVTMADVYAAAPICIGVAGGLWMLQGMRWLIRVVGEFDKWLAAVRGQGKVKAVNICLCGAEAGYPHDRDCPRPLYLASDSAAEQWEKEYEAKRQARLAEEEKLHHEI